MTADYAIWGEAYEYGVDLCATNCRRRSIPTNKCQKIAFHNGMIVDPEEGREDHFAGEGAAFRTGNLFGVAIFLLEETDNLTSLFLGDG